jgi:hypothetical protein
LSLAIAYYLFQIGNGKERGNIRPGIYQRGETVSIIRRIAEFNQGKREMGAKPSAHSSYCLIAF